MSRRQTAALNALVDLLALACLLAFVLVACPAAADPGQASTRGGCGTSSNPCKAVTFRTTRSTGGGVGFCMDGYGGSTSASWGAAALAGYYGLYIFGGKGCSGAAAPAITYNNATGLVAMTYGVHAGRGLGASLALASFPTCNGTAITSGGTFGLSLFDTTNSVWKFCNGSAWVAVGTGVTTSVESWWHGYYSASDGTGATETTWSAATPAYDATLEAVTLAVLRAGAGTSGTVSVRVYNSTKAAVACTCSFACDAADGTATNCSCGSTAVAAGDALLLQWASLTSCTTPPSINVNVRMLETR